MDHDSRPSGIPVLGNVPWGSHICQFYQTPNDLLDLLVPYFKAGLENNEFCMWIACEPLSPAAAEAALRAAVRDFDARLGCGQLLILSTDEWYLHDGQFDPGRVLDGWLAKYAEALAKGFTGLRLSGNTFWLERKHWRSFTAYEAAVDAVISSGNLIALCTYPLEKCGANEILDVVKSHSLALIRRDGAWEMIESQARRRALEAEKESRLNYESLFGNMIDGFAYHRVICDDTGKPIDYQFVEVNGAFELLTGLVREQIVGRRASEVIPGIEADPADWIGRYGRVALSGEPARFEQFSPLFAKWFSVSAYSPRQGYFAVTFEDITERKRSEAAIRDLNGAMERQLRALEISNSELESFAYSVSHDLIAPLRSINGFCQIVLEDHGAHLAEDAKSALERVRASSRHMAGLIDVLLELSRLTRAELNRARVDASALARDIADALRRGNPERHAAFHIQEEIKVEADPVMLRAALENLLGNAWKFTARQAEARIEFSCRRERGDTVYCVRDNGVGFEMGHARKLFAPFHRLHTTDEFPGLGIGLATVQRIVQRHGGEIWAEATPGRGAAFFFRLGEEPGDAGAVENDGSRRAHGLSNAATPGRAAGAP